MKNLLANLGFVLSVIFIICLFTYFPTRHLSASHKYTVAIVTEIIAQSEGDNSAKIEYRVNGKSFYGYISSYKGNNQFYKKGDRFFVEFYLKDPNESRIIDDLHVPDTLITLPLNGWDALPIK